MACEFAVNFEGDAASVVSGAKAAVEKTGGKLAGDEIKGQFSVPKPAIEGSYRISGSAMHITIDKKPMIVPCGIIESFIRERFKRAG
jgi:hypothetical protein